MAEEYNVPVTPLPPEQPKKSNTTMIIIIVVAALLLLCCCCAAAGYGIITSGMLESFSFETSF